MVCEMENTDVEEMDAEALSSMWPEDINEAGRLFNVERPGADLDMLKEVTILEEPTIVDFKRLSELTNYSENGSSQLSYLVKNWEFKQANAVRLLREELHSLSKQRHQVELKQQELLEQHRFEEVTFSGNKRTISILDGVYDIWPDVPRRIHDEVVPSKGVEVDAKDDTVLYWKQRTVHLEKLLEASVQREQILVEKLQDSIEKFETQSSPVEELSEILKRADNFLHFILQTAPVVIGHQDSELRYRFIYNHFPSLAEEEIIGKTDVEIFTGAGVKESQDFKREVLERGKPAKREITFETELFGSKTFLIYVEPVFSKAGDTIGVNYMGMDVTDQVRKREKMAKLREEIAVQNAKETELNKTIHITEETMRAKQMLATMSHEIRSPLSGVVSMAEILSTTNLDKEQKQLLNVMLSSGDLVLQLINDILDLSKVESGVMKLEATKFRPREVVRHVLQTAAASLQKILTLEGHIADDVPIEVIGDVLRIRQILTNLISNAVKFTHEGKVGIKLYVIPAPTDGVIEGYNQLAIEGGTTEGAQFQEGDRCPSLSECCSNQKYFHGHRHEEGPCNNHRLEDDPQTPGRSGDVMDGGEEHHHHHHPLETTVWIRCDVYDTGIGIPEKALPTLFKKYMQAGADTQRKYGGTGLGLAICKQLVELMGGHLTVSSQEHHGSTFTFILPYTVSPVFDSSDDPDEDMVSCDAPSIDEDLTTGYFEFQPRTLFTSNGSTRVKNLLPESLAFDPSEKLTGTPENIVSLKETTSSEDDRVVEDGAKRLSSLDLSTTDVPESNKKIKVDSEVNVGSKLNGPSPCLSVMCTHPFKEGGDDQEEARARRLQEESALQERINTNSQCTSSNAPEVSQTAKKPTILLVEDNKINVMVAKSMMKQLGHTLTVVSNGVEAIQAVQSHHYDLVLMDVYMPVMNGLQATRIIRSFEETGNWDAAVEAGIEQPMPSTSSPGDEEPRSSRSRIPIIAMTANSMSESAEECYANGMDSFVSKPVTFQKLKDCLEQFVK